MSSREGNTPKAKETLPEARLQTVIENLSEGLVIADLEGNLLHWNPAALSLHGFKDSYDWQRHLSEFQSIFELHTLSGERLPFEQWPMSRLFRGESVRDLELRLRRVGEAWERVFRYNGSVLRPPDGEPLAFLSISDLTERTRALEALRYHEAVLRETGELAKVGGWTLDLEAGEVFWTDEVARIHDLEPGARLPLERGLEFYTKESRRKVEEALDRAVRAHENYDIVLEFTSAHGRRKWVRTIGIPVIERGKVVRIRGSLQDITEFKEAQDERERESRRMGLLAGIAQRLVMSSSPMDLMAHIFDELARELDVDVYAYYHLSPSGDSLRLQSAFGLTEEQRQHFSEIVFEQSLCGVVARTRQPVIYADLPLVTSVPEALGLIQLGLRAYAGHPLLAGDRLIGTLSFGSKRRDRYPPGDLRLMKAVADQVSACLERERLLADLRESSERFRQVVETIDEVFWIAGPNGFPVHYISPAYEKVWGRPCATLYHNPMSWAESIHPEDRDRVIEAARTQQQSGDYAETYRIIRPDGSLRWISSRSFPIRNAQGELVSTVGTATDVTRQRHLEEQMLRAQKLEAIGTLAGGIAHDFNNILGAIVGHTELVKMDAMTPSAQESLSEILRACRRAADLVSQILTFSRQQRQTRVPTNLASVINEATKLLRAAVPTTIEFDLRFSADAPQVLADPTQIHQVLMNLCTNAAYAMAGRQGRLGIRLEAFQANRTWVQLHPGAQEGSYAHLSVSDNGVGIDENALSRLFDPFFTTKPPGEGTGLGLAVVHGIVQNHEGVVTVTSRPGEGTTFDVYLPALTGDFSSEPSDPNHIPTGHGETILFVDDEAAIAGLGAKMLKKLGYVGESFTDPTQAWAAFQSTPGKYDLVLTDLTMPGLSGTDLAARISALRPATPIVLMTGFFSSLTAEQIRAIGIREIILKPATLQTLAQSIQRVLHPAPSS